MADASNPFRTGGTAAAEDPNANPFRGVNRAIVGPPPAAPQPKIAVQPDVNPVDMVQGGTPNPLDTLGGVPLKTGKNPVAGLKAAAEATTAGSLKTMERTTEELSQA